MKKLLVSCLFVTFAVASTAYPQCATPLPNPVIEYKGGSPGTPGFLNVDFGVVNFAKYDHTLFAASPELPACGLNKNASRTYVEIYTDTGVFIYGYCALTQNTQLQKLSFPLKDTTATFPKGFFIRMRDRKCNKLVQSNTHLGF